MRETNVNQLAAALDQGAAVVDVREPGEFRDDSTGRQSGRPAEPSRLTTFGKEPSSMSDINHTPSRA